MMDPQRLATECATTMWDADAASQQLGMSMTSVGPGTATLTMKISASMVNGLDVCHGGVVFTLADSAMAFACNGYNDMTFAASADITWLRPGKLGDQLTASASESAKVGRNGVYDVTVKNQRGEVVALFRGLTRSTGKPMLDDDSGDGLTD